MQMQLTFGTALHPSEATICEWLLAGNGCNKPRTRAKWRSLGKAYDRLMMMTMYMFQGRPLYCIAKAK